MFKFFKRLFCKHQHQECIRTDLEKQKDGSFKTHHVWQCKDCGKVF